jgi:hypothetical protein
MAKDGKICHEDARPYPPSTLWPVLSLLHRNLIDM